MCLKPPRVVVFDIDDTLYLERDYVTSGFRAVGKLVQHDFGCPGFDAECTRLFKDGLRGEIFNQALGNLGLPPDPGQVAQLVDAYRRHAPSIELLHDARDLLNACVDHVEIAVISDGAILGQQQKVDALELQSWTNHIVLTDQWGRSYWKPHPRAYSYVENVFHASGSECVYVADNPHKDFHAPRKLGWRTVRIRRPGSLHEHVQLESDCRVDLEVTDLWGIGQAIQLPEGSEER